MKRPKRHAEPWTDADEAMLGTASDRLVAQKMGRTHKAVETHRLALGIPPHTPVRRTWTKRELALLGKMPDAEVARRLKISRRCVLRTRRRFGIPCSSPINTPKKFRGQGDPPFLPPEGENHGHG